MQCLACGEQLKSEAVNGLTVARCEGCAGMWLSVADFGQLVRNHEHSIGVRAPTPRTLPSAKVDCPKCRRPSVPFNYAYDSGIFISRCPGCDGIWLEDGQLEQIARHRAGSPAEQRLGQALGAELRTENRLRWAREWLRSRALSTSFAVFYLLIAAQSGGLSLVLQATLFLVWPLACIWFPDGMGNLVGVSLGYFRPVITQQTPGDFVAIGGWILLLSPLVAFGFLV